MSVDHPGDHEATIPYGGGLIPNSSVKTKTSTPPAMELSRAGRGRLKSRVTIAAGKLQFVLLDEESDLEAVTTSAAKLEEDFTKFVEYHNRLHATLSEDETVTSTLYFYQVEQTVLLSRARVAHWKACKERSELYDEDEVQVPTSESSEPAEDQSESPSDKEELRSPSTTEIMRVFNDRFESLEKLVNQSLNVTRTHSTPMKAVDSARATAGPRGRPDLSTINEEENAVPNPYLKSLAESLSSLARGATSESRDTSTNSTMNTSSVKLPKFKLKVFSGEPIEYWPFIKSFMRQVADHHNDPAIRLGVLTEYTSGDVSDLIHSCNMRETPAAAYERALELLEENYGQAEAVCQAWLDKFNTLPAVKSTASLFKLRALLTNCYETLRSVDQLAEFQTKSNLAIIVNKLPPRVRERWQQNHYEVTKVMKKKITLWDLLEFCNRVYHEKADLNFGGEFELKSDTKPPVKSVGPRPQKVFASRSVPADECSGGVGSRSGGVSACGVPGSSMVAHAHAGGSAPQPGRARRRLPPQGPQGSNHIVGKLSCLFCSEEHLLFRCPSFAQKSPRERLKFTLDSNLCLNCFNAKHFARDCTSHYRCRTCNGRHHTLLHCDDGPTDVVSYTGAYPEGIYQGPKGDHVATTVSRGKIALPIVPVVCYGSRGTLVTYALLDQGSTATLCTEALVKRMGLATRRVESNISTVETDNIEIVTDAVDFAVSAIDDTQQFYLRRVLARPSLNLHVSCKAFKWEADKWEHLKGIPIHDVDASEVELLIGQNHAGLLFAIESVGEPSLHKPFAARTALGWYVCGPMGGGESRFYSGMTCLSHDELMEKCERFWKVDEIPYTKTTNPEAPAMSHEDKEVLNLWEKEAKICEEGKYMLPIPFKDGEPDFEDNREDAIRRLLSLTRRLWKAPKTKDAYIKSIHKDLELRIAEPVPDEELVGKKGRVNYIPHLPAFHPRKPDVPRRVYDCGAKWKGKSLNDRVKQGPDLMNRLLDVLIKFRENRVVTKGDIEGMYNQILVVPEQRDSMRWIWWENDVPGGKIKTYRMRTHLFGGIWSPSCANFVVKKVAKDFGDQYPPEVKRFLEDRFYVDDGIDTQDDVTKATKLILDARDLLKKGGFNFTKFMSNLTEVLVKLPPENLSKVAVEMIENLPGDVVDVVLGCLWLPRSDELFFRAHMTAKESTRRAVLSDMASVYDPLGLITPVVMAAKMVFQEACRTGLTWDDTLPDQLLARWEAWKIDVQNLQKIHFMRCMLPKDLTLSSEGLKFFLHHFSDSSQQAYGASLFVAVQKEDETVGVTLLTSKGRLAPVKRMTIPRLELCGAVVSAQLDVYLKETMSVKIQRSWFWTDSMIVLFYILNLLGRWPTFVDNRVSFIRQQTELKGWRHVPTSENPADILSRGAKVEDLETSTLWKEGPAFLRLPEDEWPSVPELDKLSFDREQLEVKKSEKVMEVSGRKPPKIPEGLETFLNHWDTWFRLCKATVYIVKFVKHLAKRPYQKRTSPEEIEQAEWGIVKTLQQQFKDTRDGNVLRQLKKAFPVEQEGLLRVGGRTAKAGIHPDAIHPLLIPPGPPARALIWEYHVKTGHGSAMRVQHELYRKYWIVNAGPLINMVRRSCVLCQKIVARPRRPHMSELPEDRVVGDEPPFSRTGVDYFGPILVKERRIQKKRYGCLFTCLQTRAVHLELAWSLDTDSFLLAVNRFVARRGIPKKMRSDNGSNFVGGKAVLDEAIKNWNQNDLSGRLTQRGISWTFNTPLASHHGGVWERMIRSVRVILMNLCNQQVMSEEALGTFFCMAEDMINGRPITAVSSDPTDLAALCPNNLLKPNTKVVMPLIISDEKDRYRKRWRMIQYLSDVFWLRWRREYLPTLLLRTKWYRKEKNLCVGDLVLITDEMTPRSVWLMGRIVEVFPDEHGVVRSAEVRSALGTYRRPVTKLCLLEAAMKDGCTRRCACLVAKSREQC